MIWGGTRKVKLLRIIAMAVFLAQLAVASVRAQLDWRKQWEATVQAAKKEGEVVIYGPHNPAYQQIWAIFQKSYPDIKFSFVPGKGADHAQRIVSERRAGKYLADLLMGGSSSLQCSRPAPWSPSSRCLSYPKSRIRPDGSTASSILPTPAMPH